MSDLDPRLQSAFEHMLQSQSDYTEALKLVEENSELTAARIAWEEADDHYHQLQYKVRKENRVDAKLDAMCKAEIEFYDQRDLLTPLDAETVIRGDYEPLPRLKDEEYQLTTEVILTTEQVEALEKMALNDLTGEEPEAVSLEPEMSKEAETKDAGV